jgi:hypothetical protein
MALRLGGLHAYHALNELYAKKGISSRRAVRTEEHYTPLEGGVHSIRAQIKYTSLARRLASALASVPQGRVEQTLQFTSDSTTLNGVF